MRLLGNILWVIFGGLVAALAWALVGALWCITVVGIPIGLQCFKFASLSLWPFGRDIEFSNGVGSTILNIFWIIFSGLEMALSFVGVGAIFCITIIGIPFGLQYFKFAKLALMPLGARIVPVN